jgi:F-type H+-transporting ATPase subunit delta
MDQGLISKRYARALYQFATEHNEAESLYYRMKILADNLVAMPELTKTLNNPMVSANEKKQLLTVATGANPEQSYLDFIDLVMTNHREKFFHSIALSYADYYRRQRNINVVYLTFADCMPDGILARIKQRIVNLTQGEVEMTISIDPSISGGFIFKMNDQLLDASVVGQLKQIRKQLSEKEYYT